MKIGSPSRGRLGLVVLVLAAGFCGLRPARSAPLRLVPRPLTAPPVCELMNKLGPIRERHQGLIRAAAEAQALLNDIPRLPSERSLNLAEKGKLKESVGRLTQALQGLLQDPLHEHPEIKELASALGNNQALLKGEAPPPRGKDLSSLLPMLQVGLRSLEARIDEYRAESGPGASAALDALNIRCSVDSFLTGQCQKQLEPLCPIDGRLKALGSTEPLLAAAGSGVSWEASLLSGLTDFMVDRANQELVLWLVSMFQNRLCTDAQEWFPQTCRLLKLSDSHSQTYGSLLSSALRADLDGMPVESLKALYGASRSMPGLLSALSREDLEAARHRASALWVELKPALRSGCGAAPGCTQLAIAGVLTLAADTSVAMSGVRWEARAACVQVQRWLNEKKDPSGELFGSLLGQSSAGLSLLLKEVQGVSDCGSIKPKGRLALLLDLIQDVRELAPGRGTQPQAVVPRTLAILARFGPLLHDTEGAEDAELKRLSQKVSGFIAGAYAADGLYGLLVGVRKGEPPLELLASLGFTLTELIKGSGLCQPEAEKAHIACVMAAAGTLLGRMSGVLAALNKGVTADGGAQLSWDDTAVCKALRDLVHDKALLDSISGLMPAGSTTHVPLLDFMREGVRLQCAASRAGGEADLPSEYLPMRALVRSVFALEQKLLRWRESAVVANASVAAESLQLLGNLLEAATTVLGQSEQAEVQRLLVVMRATGDALRGSYADGVRAIIIMLGSQGEQYLPEGFKRYAMLIGDLASARDPKDVAAALSAAAAPVGSWRVKRQGRINISISGLLGMQAGGELVPSWADQNGALKHGAAIGPMAALGVDLSGPIGGHWTMGLFGTVLDAGALAWARLSGNGAQADAAGQTGSVQTSAKVPSEIGVLNVLSPGLYLKLGAGRSPFAFGAGFSYAPQLRTYFYRNAEGADQQDITSMFRVGFFLAVDLTLLPIFSG